MSADARMLGDRYRIEALLGQGGMAQVYRGEDTVLNRPVAIKVLAQQYAKDPSFVQRFRREAQAAAKLNQPNVVGVYDTGSDDGTHYIVMEFVEGRTLADFLSKGGKLMPERATELTESVCLALTAAHNAGIVHRDIKPGNIMVTRSGEVKVMDFGIARAATGEAVTQTATVLGTASYLSPEQAKGQPVDARSDIYSLGVVLFEMLTARVPFTGDSAVAVAYKHVQEMPEPPSTLNPDVSPGLDAVVMKSLAKNPDNRYQSAEELRQDLDRARRGVPVLAPAVLAGESTQVIHRAGEATAVLAPTGGPARKRPAWLIPVIVVLAVALVGAGLFFAGRSFLVGNANQVAVPKLTGGSLAEAKKKLHIANLKVGSITESTNASVAPGTVLSQTPPSGTKIDEGSTVSLIVAKAPAPAEIPSVTGKTLAEATTALQDAGFKVGGITRQSSDTVRRGRVISQSPTGKAQRGTAVDLVISSGQANVTVIDIICEPLGQARGHLQQIGLTLTESGNTQFNPQCPHTGRVATQDPASGTSVKPGSTVTVDTTESKPKPSPTAT